ncbi:hypothetical protein C2G38_2174963 [Gigaspora rosea]|uniref:Uncharacterized protein n=1 Tax=Gigaspora rosea TaxID=44941 RepID=A0A397VJL3_9GLOM|nr:hypothetical protein C2G38_2174963 [Gigaspora rosea]
MTEVHSAYLILEEPKEEKEPIQDPLTINIGRIDCDDEVNETVLKLNQKKELVYNKALGKSDQETLVEGDDASCKEKNKNKEKPLLKEPIKIKLTNANEASNHNNSYQSKVGAEEKLGVEKNKNADTSRKRRKEKIVLERVLKLAIAHNQVKKKPTKWT